MILTADVSTMDPLLKMVHNMNMYRVVILEELDLPTMITTTGTADDEGNDGDIQDETV